MDFGTAFKYSFIAFLISGLINLVGSALLYTVVDPDLPSVLAEVQMENTMEMLERFGAADSMSSEQIEKMEMDMKQAFTPLGMIKGFWVPILFYGVGALIVAAIIKKRDKSLDY